MTHADITRTILELFLEYGDSHAIHSALMRTDLDIFHADYVDSFSIISLISLVEDRFGITFSIEHLNSDEIRTIDGMSALVASLLAS